MSGPVIAPERDDWLARPVTVAEVMASEEAGAGLEIGWSRLRWRNDPRYAQIASYMAQQYARRVVVPRPVDLGPDGPDGARLAADLRAWCEAQSEGLPVVGRSASTTTCGGVRR